MNRKIKLLALISIAVVLAAVATSLVLAAQSTVKADTTAAVASDATSTPTPSAVNASNNGGLFIAGDMGFRGYGGSMGMGRGFGGARLAFASSGVLYPL